MLTLSTARGPSAGVSVLAMVLLASTACRSSTPERKGAPPTRPNVVLLMADDLGWGDTGFRGHPRMQTPHLDALAASGIRFERFYAGAPVCSPTRGSALTGRHPYRYGVRHANVGHLPNEEWTLAEILRDAGYATGHFGKWHLGTLTRAVPDSNRGGSDHPEHYAPPWEHGFERCFSTEAKVPTYDPMVDPKSGEPYGTAYWREDGSQATENLAGDDSRVIMDRVLPFVRDAVQGERPFFAVVWFHTPHKPVVAGAADREPFADLDEETQHYLGSIRAMDREIGRLRAELTDLGVERDTLLWFASDNGPEGSDEAPGSTAGLRGRKRSLYEGGLRVPGVLSWPARVSTARVVSIPAVTSDYLPTLCDLLELQAPGPTHDGISLLPWIDGADVERGRGIGFESGRHVAWIGDRFKLVGTLAKDGTDPRAVERWELYDLVDDPQESNDLAAERPSAVQELAGKCAAWRTGLR